MELSLPETKVPESEISREQKFHHMELTLPGAKVPRSKSSSIRYIRVKVCQHLRSYLLGYLFQTTILYFHLHNIQCLFLLTGTRTCFYPTSASAPAHHHVSTIPCRSLQYIEVGAYCDEGEEDHYLDTDVNFHIFTVHFTRCRVFVLRQKSSSAVTRPFRRTGNMIIDLEVLRIILLIFSMRAVNLQANAFLYLCLPMVISTVTSRLTLSVSPKHLSPYVGVHLLEFLAL